MNIQEIRVYDPKRDGLDYQTYKRAYAVAQAVNQRAADAIMDGLVHGVLMSQFEQGKTLQEFLHGSKGFFSRHHEIQAVLFIDGKFNSEYRLLSSITSNVDEIAEANNSIPFVFGIAPELG